MDTKKLVEEKTAEFQLPANKVVELCLQKYLPEIVEQDYSTPECLHDECFRDTPSADELNAILFPGHGH